MKITHESGVQSPKDVLVPLSWRRCAGSVAATLALTSCGLGASTSAEAPAPATVTATAIATKTVYVTENSTCEFEHEDITQLQLALCKDRRQDGAKLTIVSIPDLELTSDEAIDLSVSAGDLQAVGDYTARYLEVASDGEIDLDVDVIEATREVTEQIRDTNDGECIASKDYESLMSTAVEENMADEVEDAAIVAAFGGETCLDAEGVGGIASVAGVRKFLDVYNAKSGEIVKYEGQTNITQISHTLLHEILHLYGFGHAGFLNTTHPDAEGSFHADPSGIIDLETYSQGLVYSEYGDPGNVMSNETIPLLPRDSDVPSKFMNQLQVDHFETAIDPKEYSPKIASNEDTEKTVVDVENPESPVGMSVTLSEPLVVDDRKFTHANFIVRRDDRNKSFVDIIYSTTVGSDELLTTATIASIELEEIRPLTINVDGATGVEITWDGANAELTTVVQ